MSSTIRLCFVCLGNICRSPTAEGIMKSEIATLNLSDRILVDSAGTIGHHQGSEPDARSKTIAQKRGVILTSVARKFLAEDFDTYDYVLAMDQNNYKDLEQLQSSQSHKEKLFLFRSFDSSSEPGATVPDPYYGGESGFDDVFDICQAATQGLLNYLREKHSL